MNTGSDRVYECIGGPLCGSTADDCHDIGRFAYRDEDERDHFYRLVTIQTNDRRSEYTFFHYFGNNPRIAMEAHPVFVPFKRLARAKKRK